jgi:hypothetical protein
VIGRGPQILSQGQKIDRRGAKIVSWSRGFRHRLAQAQHQLVLVSTEGTMNLRRAQHLDGLLIAGARIAHRVRQAPHRLHVLREHIQPGIEHGVHIAHHALEIRRQRLDGSAGIASA